MDALKNLVDYLGGFSGVAVTAASCAASLYILATLANPAWGVTLALAKAGSDVMAANGVGLLTALGFLCGAKYLKA